MADSQGNATVFEGIACKSLFVQDIFTKENINFYDPDILTQFLVFQPSGVTLSASGANLTLRTISATNSVLIGANSVNVLSITPDGVVAFYNASDTTPTLTSSQSGALFTSGGGLWYLGKSGTYTELAVS